MAGIAEKIISIIQNHAKYEADINMDTLLVEDMGFTSIDLVEMVYEIETEFNITMELYELDFDIINRVEDLIVEIERKVNNI